jgi:hypothetical protein
LIKLHYFKSKHQELRISLVFFVLFFGTYLYGATCTTTSTTTWDCGTPGQDDDLIVNHSITITGDFTVNIGSITVNSPNILTITGNLTFNNNSTVLVNDGACLHVMGDLQNKNNSGDIEIFGTLIVDGDFTNGTGSGQGAVIDVGSTGTISIGGTCDNPGTVTDDSGSYTGDCDNPILPVDLVSFHATATELGNLLQWQTASERDNDFFEIQRSTDALNWEGIAKITGTGNSDQPIAYQYLDSNPLVGRVFYRLKQVDFDGAFEYSFIVSVVTGELPGFKVLQVFPNPTTGDIQASYVSNNDTPIKVSLMNTMGQVLLVKEVFNTFGSNQISIAIPGNQAGIYILRLENSNIVNSTKILRYSGY